MTQVQVDQALQQQLGGLHQRVVFQTPDGKILGRFLPEDEYRAMLYESVEIPYSEEEIARFRAERGGSTLDEIWKRLGRK
jgi:hypothetical protein